MTQAEDCLARMKALDITVAQAHNDIAKSTVKANLNSFARTKREGPIDTVDGIYKFYYFPDGSKLGARIREAEHRPRWPKDTQQVWISKVQ